MYRIFWGFILHMYVWTLCAQTSDEIQAAIGRGEQFLLGIQQKGGAICDTVNPLFDLWESVCVAQALYDKHSSAQNPDYLRLWDFIRANENPSGLLCHNRKCREGYCLETSSVYFSVLAEMDSLALVKRNLGLVASLQKQTGAWDIGNPNVRERRDYPSVTGFVLEMFYVSGTMPPKPAWQYLAETQNAAGHWGDAWEYYGCPAYALWANTRALSHYKAEEAVHHALARAAHFVAQTQQADGSWFVGIAPPHKQPSACLQTAATLLSLPYLEMEDKLTIQQKGIQFLLQNQQASGAWDGGFFPIPSDTYEKREYVFATALALQAMKQYLNR